ncbi:MAG TPA: isochorismatase family cysteine hydrolase [Fimbriimonadaceae bacterium]|jgi:nicotinamidase-related amidase
MPLTELDPKAALIVIDLQKGIVGFPTVTPASEIIEKAAELAEAFRETDHEVVWVHVTDRAPGRTDAGTPKMAFPDGWDQLVHELNRKQSDHVVEKRRWGAFVGTNLDEILKTKGVTQVFMAGISTSAGVESTARSAYDLGYNVVFITDAMTDRTEEAQKYCVETLFPKMGETCTCAEVLEQLGA